MFVERSDKNPILKPNKDQSWEAQAVFNGCPVKKGEEIYLLYRALSLPHYHALAQTKLMVSDIGMAQSKDGIHFSNRRHFIVSEELWERFGCEDPRITKLNNKYYIFYTALSAWPPRAEGIKIGLAISKDLKTVDEKHLITPFNAKAMALFPEKMGGKKMWAVLTINTDKLPAKICLASFEKENDLWSETYWNRWYKNFEKYSLPLQRRPQDHVEVGAPPIKTKHGWLLLYSYIRNYFSRERLFTIEAVLLDLHDPLKIIGRAQAPLLTPEEYYERIGLVPDVIFPSGAILKENIIHLYYGAADTTCCLAFINLPILMEKLLGGGNSIKLIRAKENPIITAKKNRPWEAETTFNPGAICLDGKVHIVYRAMSEDNISVFGYAASKDGFHIDERLPEPIYIPREPFEQKLMPGGNSGCEDPRLTKIGDKIYMLYTAFDGKNPPRVALTWITAEKFLKKKWDWSKPILISPPDLDDKDACLFPKKFKGKYLIVHRVGNDIDFAFSPTLDFASNNAWLEEQRWVTPRKGMWDSKKVGIAAPPIKTEDGWILFYHGISEEDNSYRVGALLLDLNDPIKIIGRSDEPLLEPEMPYEKEGQTPNVVFPCGAVLIGDKIFVYYGGADQVVGAATIKLADLLAYLKRCKY
ncbi:MAG: hypothetical protein HYX23_00460 [Candidatus Zambryskibacteria bacterium]|nr:hypothetical protein [Candidatus Zambryskibacteria bacterium]